MSDLDTLDPDQVREGLDRLVAYADQVQAAAEDLASRAPAVTNVRKLASLVRKETRFLHRIRTKLTNDSSPNSLKKIYEQGRSANIGYLGSIIEAACTEDDVLAVQTSVPVESMADGGALRSEGRRRVGEANVDVIAQGGLLWIRVRCMSPAAVQLNFHGLGRPGDPCLAVSAGELLTAAALPEAETHYRRPLVVFRFPKGVTTDVAAGLEEIGVQVQGTRIRPACRYDEPSESELAGDEPDVLAMDEVDDGLCAWQTGFPKMPSVPVEVPAIVNLDTSTLIVLITELCNGVTDVPFSNKVVERMRQDELKVQTVPPMLEFMEGKEVVACKTAVQRFERIVELVAGERERARAQQLMARVRVVDDMEVDFAKRACDSSVSRRVSGETLTVFCTGHSLRATTMTSNTRVIRSLAKSGIVFETFVHEARCLTEQMIAEEEQAAAVAAAAAAAANDGGDGADVEEQ